MEAKEKMQVDIYTALLIKVHRILIIYSKLHY
jgi:hypothetical protein